MDVQDILASENPIKKIADLQPGDHLCCIYETDEEHRNVLTPFIREGLEANQKVIYIVDANTAEEILDYLREIDFNPEPYLEEGQLVLMTGKESYVKGGTFDPDAMIDMLKRETEKALEEGYSALRVTGEMTWALRGLPGSDRLMEYENKLNRFLPNHQALGLCQYDRTEFDSEVLLGVLRTHPIAVIGEEVYENFYYIPPELLLGENPKEAEFSSWEKGLKRNKSGKLRRKHLNSLLRSISDVNQLLVRIEDEEELIQETCNILADTRGYGYVWLALLEDSSEVDRIAYAGLDEEQDLKPLREQLEGGGLPEYSRKALTESGIVIHDPPVSTSDLNLTEGPRQKKLLTTRLEYGGKVYGFLSASVAAEFVGSEEEDLLEEVAGDVGFGLHNMAVEEKLRESEKKYRQIFNNANDAMYLHKLTEEETPGQFIEVNDSACEMLGYSREELLSMTPKDLDAGRTAEDLPDVMEDLLANGHTTFEMHHQTKDGQLVPVEISSHLFEIDGEKRVLSIARDITERKELQRRKDLFSSSLQQASLGVYWVKPDGSFAYTNQKVKQMLGYSEEELTDMHVWDVDPTTEHAEDKREEIWRKLKEKGTLYFESVNQTKEGDKFPVEVTSTYIQHGGEEYQVAFVKEVTKRKKAKRELRESEKKFRSYVENAPLGVFLVDEKGNYLEVNEAACEVTGYTEEELLNLRITDIPPPEARDKALEEFEGLFEKGEMKLETPYVKKDGTKGHMVINAVKLREDRYLGFTMDITERKEAKKELRQATLGTLKALNRTIEAKDEYTGEHIDRVQRLSVEVAKEVGLSEDRSEQLRYASTLHDIGKIGVSDSILGKTGELTEEEWAEMERHPQVGERIVRQVDRLERAAKIIGQHQEKYDGSGYPKGLEGEEITLEARILAVADAWDAMRSNRPYRKALPREEAIRELKENSGTQFDPDIVDIMLEMIEEEKIEFSQKDQEEKP
jgi:PAS domain S-box-containing protein